MNRSITYGSRVSFGTCVAGLLFCASPARASDWNNVAGDSARSGLSRDVGPSAASVAWTSPSAAASGSPIFIEGNRAFRAGNFSSSASPATAECFDVDTGALSWSKVVPLGTLQNGRGYCLGVDHGRAYFTRREKIYALDSANGAVVWESALAFTVSSEIIGTHILPALTLAFAPDGDLIVDAYESVVRIRGGDGATVWETPRPAAGVGGLGVAVHNGSVYAHLNSSLGNELMRLDLTSGSLLYLSGPLSDTPPIGPPFMGADGSIHAGFAAFLLTSPAKLVTLRDDGSAFVPQWTVSTAASGVAGYATSPDGSVIHAGSATGTSLVLERLDAGTGNVIATSAAIPYIGYSDAQHLAVDASGRVYLTTRNGASIGKVIALDPNLAQLWSQSVAGDFVSGPALGRDGTLVLASGGIVTAFRTEHARGRSFCFGDGGGTACPCTAGFAGNGCPNSEFAGGARLTYDGVASASSDSFSLHGFALPSGPCLFFQGSSSAIGSLGTNFGDGLLCLGGTVIRLGVDNSVQGLASYPGPSAAPVSAAGFIPTTSPVARSYQIWFRDTAAFCGGTTFNLTNGIEVLWVP